MKWQDLSEKVVYRRFTEIYEFHVSVWWQGGRDGTPTHSQLCLLVGRATQVPAGSEESGVCLHQPIVKGAFFKL